MKWFIYIISTSNNASLTVGYSNDILKVIKFYKGLPNLFYLPSDYHKLVYVEEHADKVSAINRFDEINTFTKEIKEVIVEGVNPNYTDLIPGVNFELI